MFVLTALRISNPTYSTCCVNVVPLWSDPVLCFVERVLRDDERPLEILQEWGQHQEQVKFVLRYTVLPSAMNGKY
jgi:hypothetical protein